MGSIESRAGSCESFGLLQFTLSEVDNALLGLDSSKDIHC
jgi:hypothetical protein